MVYINLNVYKKKHSILIWFVDISMSEENIVYESYDELIKTLQKNPSTEVFYAKVCKGKRNRKQPGKNRP